MNLREIRQFEVLLRVRDFSLAHADLFPAETVAAQSFTVVSDAVQQLNDYAVAGMATIRRTAKARAAARLQLLDALEAVTRTARVIEDAQPGFRHPFHLPKRRPASVLLAAGRLFARELDPFAKVFIAHGMPATFIADLKALAERLETAIRVHQAGREETTAARTRIDGALDSGMGAIKALDVIVANHLRHDAATTAVWAQAKRVGNRRRKALVKPADPVTPSVPGASPPSSKTETAPTTTTPADATPKVA